MPAMESGWLVEEASHQGCEPRFFLLGGCGQGWTRESSQALRFARKQDAQAFALYFIMDPASVRVREHIWEC